MANYALVPSLLLGALIFHQVSAVCYTCRHDVPDDKCRDSYDPKSNDLKQACPNKDIRGKLCAKYKVGWRVLCRWGDDSMECKTMCPRNSAAMLKYDVIIMTFFVVAILLQRHVTTH